MDKPLDIAVIGSGVAGITASYLLQNHHNITLFEKNDYVGGHTNTIVIEDGPDAGIPVDTGFIVMNNRTYPLLSKLLSRLDAKVCETDMSFGYYCKKTGLQYASTDFNTLFAQRHNILKPSFWRLLAEIVIFMKKTRRDLYNRNLSGMTIGEYVKKSKFSSAVVEKYIVPMAAAIWSASDSDILNFPMEAYGVFFENHGLLTIWEHPVWYYVEGGSHTYVKSFLKGFNGKVELNSPVSGISRNEQKVKIRIKEQTHEFDSVIIATHADESLKLLDDPSENEEKLLSKWQYQKNRVVLHTDRSMMPPNKKAWGSWNYIREITDELSSPVTITYYMNRLQRLKTKKTYCVTLNPYTKIKNNNIIQEFTYAHPSYTFDSIATQKYLNTLNGKHNTYFCGSYFGYGFHEDAVKSSVEVAKLFGVEL